MPQGTQAHRGISHRRLKDRVRVMAMQIAPDETVEELLSIREDLPANKRKQLGLRVFRDRQVNLLGYEPDQLFTVVTFKVPVRVRRRRVEPGNYIVFNDRGPLGFFTNTEFKRHTGRARRSEAA